MSMPFWWRSSAFAAACLYKEHPGNIEIQESKRLQYCFDMSILLELDALCCPYFQLRIRSVGIVVVGEQHHPLESQFLRTAKQGMSFLTAHSAVRRSFWLLVLQPATSTTFVIERRFLPVGKYVGACPQCIADRIVITVAKFILEVIIAFFCSRKANKKLCSWSAPLVTENVGDSILPQPFRSARQACADRSLFRRNKRPRSS